MPARDGVFAEIMAELESPVICALVAHLIGEPEVFPDPTQFGGGLHAIPSGGFLGMHTDFRFHPSGRRRVANCLLYMNREWREEWGGALTLGLNVDSVSYAPLGGRLVIFRTDQYAWHGHPAPTCTPDGVFRRSIAAYYYTRERGRPDTTVYRK